jgi:hypothetical protein
MDRSRYEIIATTVVDENRRYTQNPCSGHFECNRDISPTERYNPSGMTLFESHRFLNRTRELENHSVRPTFIGLLILLFLFGANVSLVLYQIVRLHRFPSSGGAVLLMLGFLVFRLTRIIYRQLGR